MRFIKHSNQPYCTIIQWIVDCQSRAALLAGEEGLVPREELIYDHQLCPCVVEIVEGSALNALLVAKYSDCIQRHSVAASATHPNRPSSWLGQICFALSVSDYNNLLNYGQGEVPRCIFFFGKVDIIPLRSSRLFSLYHRNKRNREVLYPVQYMFCYIQYGCYYLQYSSCSSS